MIVVDCDVWRVNPRVFKIWVYCINCYSNILRNSLIFQPCLQFECCDFISRILIGTTVVWIYYLSSSSILLISALVFWATVFFTKLDLQKVEFQVFLASSKHLSSGVKRVMNIIHKLKWFRIKSFYMDLIQHEERSSCSHFIIVV